ncbi:hypothetical protein NIIDMKKI_06250 [Mycobacterium kansasii]|uniref:RyR domain protein n=1 Tax=Mycobacterium kansasii TaxID=1768 RepID=A0A7G1I7A3_MYCKA|nr:hypothetical protein NIIDMKKI_06250 [Mycobacterium kansasii]
MIALLITMSAVLGLSSYWGCHDANHPAVFTPLMWTAQLVKGSTGDTSLSGRTCPNPTPVGLELARIAALSAIFTGLGGVVVGVFRSQVDRLRANLADSVTAIVGVDDDTESMVSAIARTLDRRSTLVVITNAGDDRVQRVRRLGARVVLVDLNAPSTLVSLRLWRHLGRLYLMSPDPATNLMWLDLIGRRLAEIGDKQRLPLIVRIDDPWLAEAWRAQQFGGSDTRWAADVVGRYEVTAGRLLDGIIATPNIQRVFICGTSQLTLALCADLTRRALERDFYTPPGVPPLPALTLVERDAEDYLKDHQFYRQQAGFLSDGPAIDAVPEAPTVPTLLRLIGDADPATCAVILVDTHSAATGTRLGARLPAMPVYAWDPNARGTEDSSQIVGLLQTYSLALDTRQGQVQDAWERAARLIHERYVATIDPNAPRSPAVMPWAQLDEFYRGSNRRQVRNALWMVERIAGHTWNTWGSPPAQLSGRDMADLPPLEQLALMGFDRYSALSMAKAEHEDWCRYYRRNGWKYGTPATIPAESTTSWSTGRRWKATPTCSTPRCAAWRPPSGACASWATGHARCGDLSLVSGRSPLSSGAARGPGSRIRDRPCARPRETGPSKPTVRPGRCATTSSGPPMRTSATDNGAGRGRCRVGPRMRARRSTPWKGRRSPRTETGWYAAVTASNGQSRGRVRPPLCRTSSAGGRGRPRGTG